MTIPPAPPYLGPAAHHGAADNKPIHRVVIHSTVSPCVAGQARATAAYFRGTDRDASAHYVVDPAEVVQVVYDSVEAYHAPPNQHSLGVELCDIPSALTAARWLGRNHRAELERAAELVAQLCLAYGVPVRYVTAAQLRAGAHGITTHAEVSAAWRQTTHWDPGRWPRRRFIRKVRKYAHQLGETP